MKKLLAVVYILSTIIGEHGGGATVVTGCPHTYLTLTCPAGYIIEVISADYGRHSTTLCPYPDPAAMQNTQCSLDKTAQTAKKCNRYQNCDIVVDEQNVDPCVGTYKYLTANYVCNQYIPPPGAVTPIMSCPHTILTVVCPPSTYIEILTADYGRISPTLCPYPDPGAMRNTQCRFDETAMMAQKCNGYQTCGINVDEGQVTDPCVGTYKYLSLTHTCKFRVTTTLAPLTTHAPLTTPSPVTSTSPPPVTSTSTLPVTTSSPTATTPPVCPENEEFACDNPCFRHCNPPATCRNTCDRRCVCKERFRRDAATQLCIDERYCPLSTIEGDTNEVFSACDANCQSLCTDPTVNCDGTRCVPGYVCTDNYLRDFTTGRCVLSVDCYSDPIY